MYAAADARFWNNDGCKGCNNNDVSVVSGSDEEAKTHDSLRGWHGEGRSVNAEVRDWTGVNLVQAKRVGTVRMSSNVGEIDCGTYWN